MQRDKKEVAIRQKWGSTTPHYQFFLSRVGRWGDEEALARLRAECLRLFFNGRETNFGNLEISYGVDTRYGSHDPAQAPKCIFLRVRYGKACLIDPHIEDHPFELYEVGVGFRTGGDERNIEFPAP